tara:strand:- start:427 stop:1005 length:579 start_codon:yes stop_codon:yes gene_type:complete
MTNILSIIKNENNINKTSLFSYLINITEEELFKKYWLNNNILHLLSIYNPENIPDVIYSPFLQKESEFYKIFISKNIFGYTWFHVLCQYNANYYDIIKEFLNYEILAQTDIVGNTCLHILARFNPLFIKKILENNLIDKYILFKKDVLGNTFLHILNYYHPLTFSDISYKFDKELIEIKNYYGKECYKNLIN